MTDTQRHRRIGKDKAQYDEKTTPTLASIKRHASIHEGNRQLHYLDL